jgi:phosphoglycerol transferase MdoB-like AlkP superfamily enzyme
VGLFSLIFLAVMALTRLGLALMTGTQNVPLGLWPGVFSLGAWFDLLTLAWLLAPVLLYEALLPRRVRRHRLHGILRWLFFAFACFMLFFGAVSEGTFWEEFSTRFNFIAVDYLIYTHEVIGNIVQSYPVGKILAGLAATALVLSWTLRRHVLRPDRHPPSGRQRLAYLVLALAAPWLAYQLADIDRMGFSSNAYANELSGNGLMTFAAAFRRNELDFDRFYRTLPEQQAHRILKDLEVERETVTESLRPDEEDLATWHQRIPMKKPPRNVVMIMVESLSAEFLGVFGNMGHLTPNLDRLAAEGLLFTRLYATGTRTVRGLEALTLGTPPIPGQAIVRRPNNEHLATLGEILRRQGYETYFIYGGYGYFDNMNAFFAGNNYRVIDRTVFPKDSVVFENIWGVADEALFDNALKQLDQAHAGKKPFLVQIMTTSNHRPFTYPSDRIDIPSPGGRDGGVKYTDYAIGRFIESARGRPWFDDTLFVIVADHCASAAGKTRLPVKGYHIPMIFYAPKLLAPGRHTRLTSQIDVPPTLLDVMGVNGDDHFFGQSVFEKVKSSPRAFISNYQELGYYKDDVLTVLGPRKHLEAFRIDPADGQATPMAPDPRLAEEAIAYYQSAFHAFKRNELKLQ